MVAIEQREGGKVLVAAAGRAGALGGAGHDRSEGVSRVVGLGPRLGWLIQKGDL